MREIFSDAHSLDCMLEFELALSRALARTGVAPGAAIPAIPRNAITHLLGNQPDDPSDRLPLLSDVQSRDPRLPAPYPDEGVEHLDRSGLAGAVRAQETEDLPFLN